MIAQRTRFEEEALVHAEALYRFALRLEGNPERAEDLVQECFEKALKSFHQYRPGTNCKSWLFTILHNAYRMRLRSAAARRETLLQEDEGFSLFDCLEDGRDDPEAAFFAKTPSAEVRAALEEMSDQLRPVVLLSDVEGFSYQEIADILGVPLGTVRSRLNRGREQLHRRLWRFFSSKVGASGPRGANP